jgi:hypothetical protein
MEPFLGYEVKFSISKAEKMGKNRLFPLKPEKALYLGKLTGL